MAKVAVALRLSAEKLAAVDAAARLRGVSRQVVLEEAVDVALAPRLVSTRPVVDRERMVEMPSADEARAQHARDLGVRQRALNAAKERASK